MPNIWIANQSEASKGKNGHENDVMQHEGKRAIK